MGLHSPIDDTDPGKDVEGIFYDPFGERLEQQEPVINETTHCIHDMTLPESFRPIFAHLLKKETEEK